jgi:hypothetical protein
MYGLQVRKFVVVRIDTYAEEEAGIATVYNLVIPELGETNMVELGLIGDKASEEICLPQRNWIDISGHELQLPDGLHHAAGAVLQGCNPGTDSKKVESVPFLHHRMEHTTLTTVSCLGDSSNR